MFAFIPETHHWYLGLIAQNAEDAIKIQNNTAVSQEQEQGSREENKEARIVHSDTVIMSESDSFSPHEDQKMDSASQEAPVTMKITVDNDSYICDDDDAKDEIISPPAYVPPWIILQLIFDSETFLTYAMNALAFATMFTSLTVLPVYLAIEPYNLSPGLVGVTYLPVGVAMMSGAMLGGQLSDYSAVTFRSAKEGRMLYPVALACGLTVGSIGFGLTLFYGTNLAGPLLTQSLLGFCESILMPSTTAYLTSKSPDKAGAASACLFFLCFVLAAISVSFSLIISNAIGVQFFFITLGLTTFALMVLSLLQYRGAVIRGDLRAASKRSTSQLSVNL